MACSRVKTRNYVVKRKKHWCPSGCGKSVEYIYYKVKLNRTKLPSNYYCSRCKKYWNPINTTKTQNKDFEEVFVSS